MPNSRFAVVIAAILVMLSCRQGYPSPGKGEIEEIRIIGLRKTDDWIVRKLLTFAEGDTFTDDEGHRSWRRLHESHLFRQVGIFPQPGSGPGKVLILIPIVENKTDFSQSLTSGYEPVYGLYGSMNAWMYNPFGRGRKIDLWGTGAEMKFNGGFSFTHPWIFESSVDLSAGMRFSIADERLRPYEPVDSLQGRYSEKVYSFFSEARREFSPIYSVSTGFRVEEIFTSSDDTIFIDEMPEQSGWHRLVVLEQSVIRDTRTKSTNGWTLRLDLSESLPLVGSTNEFYSVSLTSTHNITFPGNNMFSVTLFAGNTVGDDVPIHEQYQFGGTKPLKGFTQRSKDQEGGLRTASVQVTYGTPVLDWWSFWKQHGRLTLFASSGHTWNEGLPAVSDFHTSWGVDTGLYFNGYGRVSIQYAYENTIRFQLQIGDPAIFTYLNYFPIGGKERI